ncbi:unnamed protein product [Alopecurus aequalis]
MSSTTTSASQVAGVWFGELSAMLRGNKRQAMAPTASFAEHQQQQTGGAVVLGKTKAAEEAKPGVELKKTGGGGMSDATVYLLLDHFAPS